MNPPQTMSTEFGLDPQAFAKFIKERDDRLARAERIQQERYQASLEGREYTGPKDTTTLADWA